MISNDSSIFQPILNLLDYIFEYNNKRGKNFKSIKPSTTRTKLTSSLAALFFLLAIGVCAYLPAGINGHLGTNEDKTFTISRALANANKPSFISLLAVAYFFLFYLMVERGPEYLFRIRIFLITLSFSLVVSLLWVTPTSNKNLHYGFASIIFTAILFYNILSFYVFYKVKINDRNLLLFLIIFNILVYITLLIFAFLKNQDLGGDVSDLFASAEIFFAIIFVSNILFIGFY